VGRTCSSWSRLCVTWKDGPKGPLLVQVQGVQAWRGSAVDAAGAFVLGEVPMDSEMRREIARHQQADYARLARTELLLADVVAPQRTLLIRALSRLSSLGRLGVRGSREQVPEAPVEISGPA
jgi:hypothetical protein